MTATHKICSSCKCLRDITNFTRKNKEYKTCNVCSTNRKSKNDQSKNDIDMFFATFDISNLSEEQYDYLVTLHDDWIKVKQRMENKLTKFAEWTEKE